MLRQDGTDVSLDDVCVPAGPFSNECTNISLKRKGEENQNLSGECFRKRLKAAYQLWDQHFGNLLFTNLNSFLSIVLSYVLCNM